MAALRRGPGRQPFDHAERAAKATGFSRLRIEADPHAEEFYRRMGAITIAYRRADLDGEERRLPIMEKPVG